MDGANVAKCQNCYLRYHCDEQTEFICRSNNYCKYIMEDTMNTLDGEQFDFDHKYIYYIWDSEVMGGPIFGKVKIVGKLTGTCNGKPVVEYKVECPMFVHSHVSVEYFENKYYNRWLSIGLRDEEKNQIFYSLDKEKILAEYNRIAPILQDKIKNKMDYYLKAYERLIEMRKQFLIDIDKEDE